MHVVEHYGNSTSRRVLGCWGVRVREQQVLQLLVAPGASRLLYWPVGGALCRTLGGFRHAGVLRLPATAAHICMKQSLQQASRLWLDVNGCAGQ